MHIDDFVDRNFLSHLGN